MHIKPFLSQDARANLGLSLPIGMAYPPNGSIFRAVLNMEVVQHRFLQLKGYMKKQVTAQRKSQGAHPLLMGGQSSHIENATICACSAWYAILRVQYATIAKRRLTDLWLDLSASHTLWEKEEHVLRERSYHP